MNNIYHYQYYFKNLTLDDLEKYLWNHGQLLLL